MKKDEKKILHRALDGEVTRTETRLLKRKLETDQKARAEFEQLKQVVRDSERLRVDAPSDFTRKVMKGVEDTRRTPRKP